MNKDCAIARDLMPLCIEDAASPDSTSMVENHIASCTDCAQHYQQMKEALPPQPRTIAQEHAAFQALAEKLHRKRRWRILRGVLAGMAVMVLLYFVWDYLAVQPNRMMSSSEYKTTLAQLKSGEVVVSVHFDKPETVWGMGSNYEYNDDAAGISKGYTIFYHYNSTHIPWAKTNKNKYYRYENNAIPDISLLDGLVTGCDKAVVWRKDDPIPPASPEMETYYQAEQELQRYTIQRDIAKQQAYLDNYYNNPFYYNPYGDILDDPEWLALKQIVDDARLAVPEWK